MEAEAVTPNRPSVIPRSAIPASTQLSTANLDVRAFAAHEVLSSIVPSARVALTWTHAQPHQHVEQQSRPTRGLLIVLEGSGQLSGPTARPVEQGDVVTIPSGQAYAFTADDQGLHALHVAFGEDDGIDEAAHEAALEQLLERNKVRAEQLLANPFFCMLRENVLDDEQTRATMRECLRVFSDAFQRFLFTRQATCRDEEYRAVFEEHLHEEIGHNDLLKVSGARHIATDPVLNATSTWFSHQMLVQDNVGKAVLNLVLETAGYHFHTLAQPVFANDQGAEYFRIHAEEDEKHKDVGLSLLEGQHPSTYERLLGVLDDGWNMLDAMTRRVATVVKSESPLA